MPYIVTQVLLYTTYFLTLQLPLLLVYAHLSYCYIHCDILWQELTSTDTPHDCTLSQTIGLRSYMYHSLICIDAYYIHNHNYVHVYTKHMYMYMYVSMFLFTCVHVEIRFDIVG